MWHDNFIDVFNRGSTTTTRFFEYLEIGKKILLQPSGYFIILTLRLSIKYFNAISEKELH